MVRDYITDDRSTVCTRSREELESRDKQLAVLTALERHDGAMTTSGLRDVTPLSNDDVRNHTKRLAQREYVRINCSKEDEEGRSLPNEFHLTDDGASALSSEEFGSPGELLAEGSDASVEQRVEALESKVSALEGDNQELQRIVGYQSNLIEDLEREMLRHEVRMAVFERVMRGADLLTTDDYEDMWSEEWEAIYEDIEAGRVERVYPRVAERLE